MSIWPSPVTPGNASTGDLIHLEGEYDVSEKGKVTTGHYVQLWMQEANEWRIHHEMWWQ